MKEYYSYSIKKNVDELLQIIDKLEKENLLLKQEQVGVIEKLDNYPLFISIEDLRNKWKTPTETKKLIEEWYEECIKILKKNNEVSTKNTKLFNKIVDTLTFMGLPKQVRDKKSRKFLPPMVNANWYCELIRLIPMTTNSEQYFLDIKNKKLEEIKKWELEEENKEKIRIEKLEKNKELMRICKKYDIKVEDSSYSLLNCILSKNKYLSLAHFLEKNRNDWNDGYSYAETGLRRFSIENPIDQEIVGCINGLISNWDGDGRCFRDCKWNYDEIFSLVEDIELMKDYNYVKENVEKLY